MNSIYLFYLFIYLFSSRFALRVHMGLQGDFGWHCLVWCPGGGWGGSQGGIWVCHGVLGDFRAVCVWVGGGGALVAVYPRLSVERSACARLAFLGLSAGKLQWHITCGFDFKHRSMIDICGRFCSPGGVNRNSNLNSDTVRQVIYKGHFEVSKITYLIIKIQWLRFNFNFEK